MSFKDLLKDANGEFVASAPFLFMRRQEFTSILSKIKLFEKIITIPGDIIECGVHKGNSLTLWGLLSSTLEPFNVGRKVIGFDTFEGFPNVSKFDGNWKNGYLGDADYRLLKESTLIHQSHSATPNIEKIRLIKGDAMTEIPKFLDMEKEILAISILYLDFDLFEPTLLALNSFYKYVVSGGIVVFDELFQKKFPGESKAYLDFFSDKPKLKKFYHDPHLIYFVKD
jgi:hypothetical protein